MSTPTTNIPTTEQTQPPLSTNRVSLAFFGSPEFAVPILESLARDHEVRLVVTQPDKPAGKGLRLQPSAVARTAEELALPLAKPVKLTDEDFRNTLNQIDIDVAVVAAYGKILPIWLLEWPEHGAINVHASLLPKHRGASPVAAAILAGDDETGITFMLMNERMDEGDILTAYSLPIDPEETTASLSTRLSQLSAEHVSDIVDGYVTGQLTPRPQAHQLATYTSLLSKQDGQINFSQPPDHLDRWVRAYHPWPGVWGWHQQKRVKLLPGDFIQLEGKKPMKRVDFLRENPDFPPLAF